MKEIKRDYEYMEEWGYLQNGKTIDRKGNEAAGGLFDREIFAGYDEDALSSYDGNDDYVPREFTTNMAKIDLAWPVTYVGHTDRIDPKYWFKMSEMVVLPPEFRPIRMREDGTIAESRLNRLYRTVMRHNRALERNIMACDISGMLEAHKKLEKAVNAVCREIVRLMKICKMPEQRFAMFYYEWALLPAKTASSVDELRQSQETCFAMAKKYYDSGDYEKARRYSLQALKLELEASVHLSLDTSEMKRAMRENKDLVHDILWAYRRMSLDKDNSARNNVPK